MNSVAAGRSLAGDDIATASVASSYHLKARERSSLRRSDGQIQAGAWL